MVNKNEHPSKEDVPIEVAEFEMEMDNKDEHSLTQHCSIEATEFGM
jgi:hypothetical protein